MKQKLKFRTGIAAITLCMVFFCGWIGTGCQPVLPAVPQASAAPTAYLNLLEDSSGGEELALPEITETPAPTSEPVPTPSPTPAPTAKPTATEIPVSEDGFYASRDEVALYLYLYGHLPDNFITKQEARKLGWLGGGLDDYAYGKSIGGDYFGNYEGLLPVRRGRKYYECDIGTMHKRSRGGKRIIYSNDGLIYYTDDHYESFSLLYGEE